MADLGQMMSQLLQDIEAWKQKNPTPPPPKPAPTASPPARPISRPPPNKKAKSRERLFPQKGEAHPPINYDILQGERTCHVCQRPFDRKQVNYYDGILRCQGCWPVPDAIFRVTCDPNQGHVYGNFGGGRDWPYDQAEHGLYDSCAYKMDHLHDGLMEDEERMLTQ